MTKDLAKTILCYGDSNTLGNIPDSDFRYPRSIRWPSVLGDLLGYEYEVICEGLCGRVLKSNQASFEKNGINYILPCILSHEPLDWVIIMLGTNDVKDKYMLSSQDIADHLKETILIIKNADIVNRENLKILAICPPEIVIPTSGIDPRFKLGVEKIRELPKLYKKVSDETNSLFLNAQNYIVSSNKDGIHLDADEHLKLAETLKSFILRN